jgi:hypothetical protein
MMFGYRKDTPSMRGMNVLVALITALLILSTASQTWADHTPWYDRGGFVKPCSLDGVNPAYHPDIFGNPAAAREIYGFVRGRDGTWQVEPNCLRGPHRN